MHDIDKIVRSRCAETEEGLERPKEMSSWQYRSRYQRREDCGSAPRTVHRQSRGCTSGQAQRTESLADESLCFSGEAASGSQMMTQEVMVPVAGLPRVLGRSLREPRGAD